MLVGGRGEKLATIEHNNEIFKLKKIKAVQFEISSIFLTLGGGGGGGGVGGGYS